MLYDVYNTILSMQTLDYVCMALQSSRNIFTIALDQSVVKRPAIHMMLSVQLASIPYALPGPCYLHNTIIGTTVVPRHASEHLEASLAPAHHSNILLAIHHLSLKTLLAAHHLNILKKSCLSAGTGPRIASTSF